MSAEISDELRAARSRAGKKGTASRWGPQRVVRLDQLDADTSRLIRALLAQRPNETAERVTETSRSASGGTDGARDPGSD